MPDHPGAIVRGRLPTDDTSWTLKPDEFVLTAADLRASRFFASYDDPRPDDFDLGDF